MFLLALALAVLPSVDEMASYLADWAKPKYSPDESHLAYLAPDERGAYNLYVDGKILTHERRAVFDYFWQKDGMHLLYLYDDEGDEHRHLYRVDLEGHREDLTPYEHTHVEVVSLSKKHPEEALIVSTHETSHSKNFYRIHLGTKELKRVAPLRHDLVEVGGDDELEPRVVVAFHDDGKKVLEVSQNGAWRSVWELDPNDRSYFPFMSLSSDQKLLLKTCTGLESQGLYEIDLQTGEKKLLFSHPHLDLVKPYFDPKSGALQAATVRYGELEWVFFDPDFEQEIQGLYGRLPEGELVVDARIAKDRKWLIRYRRDDRPNAYYLWDRDEKTLKLLLQEAPHLLNYSFGKMKSFTFTASDGLEIQGYFLVPPEGDPPYPTVLFPHGGPNSRDTWGFVPIIQFLATRGYAVMTVNYRGSDGFGIPFLTADQNEWGKRAFQDLIDAQEWAIQKGWADQQRFGIVGGSWGGFSALCGLAFAPNNFACGIALCPVVEPKSWLPHEYVPWEQDWAMKIYAASVATSITPLQFASNIRSPLLIMHGENDIRVQIRQSFRMVEALKTAHVPFEFHLMKGEGHFFLDPDNRRILLSKMEEFLSENMFQEEVLK